MSDLSFWDFIFFLAFCYSIYILTDRKNYNNSMKWAGGGHLPPFYIALIVVVAGIILIITKNITR